MKLSHENSIKFFLKFGHSKINAKPIIKPLKVTNKIQTHNFKKKIKSTFINRTRIFDS